MAENSSSSTTVSAVPEKQGQLLLPQEQFVPVYDGAGEEVGSVPKHWDDSALPPGTSRKKPAKS